MGVKAGYKQTEVGVIPKDWDTTTIRDITIKIGSGITPTGGSKRYQDYGRPFVRSQNVGWGTFKLDDLVFIDDETHNEFSGTELRKQDVLLNITGASIGRTTMVDDRLVGGNVNQHVCIIRADKDKVVPKIINLLLLYSLGQNQIENFQAGGNRQGLNFNQIGSIRIPLPPTLAEQNTIATALSDADALIQSLERLIAKKRDIKQGAMQELLTGKKRLPGFEKKKGYKQTEVGVIPEDWEVVPLGSLGMFSKGRGISKDESDSGEIPCIRYGEIYTHHNDIIHLYNSFISLDVAMSSKKLKTGDILFAGSGETKEEIGKCVAFIDDIEAYAGGDIVILTPGKGKTQFFGYLFNAPIISRQKASKGQGDAVVHISSSALSSIRVPLPPTPSEQTAIATVLSDMDAEIAALDSKLTKARQIKQGMMQELLTGWIRLT